VLPSVRKNYFKALASSDHFDVIHPTYYSLLTRQEIKECKYPVSSLFGHDPELFSEQMDSVVRKPRKAKSDFGSTSNYLYSENTKKDYWSVFIALR
jgi:hypothetical protein